MIPPPPLLPQPPQNIKTSTRAWVASQSDSCLATVIDALNSVADLLSFIDSKRNVLYTEDRDLKPFVSDELNRKLKSD